MLGQSSNLRPDLCHKTVLLIDRCEATREVRAGVLRSHGVEVHVLPLTSAEHDFSGATEKNSARAVGIDHARIRCSRADCWRMRAASHPEKTTSGRFRAAILTYPVDGIPLNSAGYVDRENPRRLVYLKHTPTCMRSARRAAGPGSAWVGSISAYPVGNESLHILRQSPETA